MEEPEDISNINSSHPICLYTLVYSWIVGRLRSLWEFVFLNKGTIFHCWPNEDYPTLSAMGGRTTLNSSFNPPCMCSDVCSSTLTRLRLKRGEGFNATWVHITQLFGKRNQVLESVTAGIYPPRAKDKGLVEDEHPFTREAQPDFYRYPIDNWRGTRGKTGLLRCFRWPNRSKTETRMSEHQSDIPRQNPD